MLRHLLTIVLLGILLIDAQAQALTPPAGTFRLGISKGNESHWLKPKEKIRGVSFQWKALPDSRGFILEVEVASAPEADALFWSFGDCQPDSDIMYSAWRDKPSLATTEKVCNYGRCRLSLLPMIFA